MKVFEKVPERMGRRNIGGKTSINKKRLPRFARNDYPG